jgi:F-type H+-transporting ATPase subunit delta
MKTTRQIKREATQLFRACIVDGLLDEKRVRQAVQQIIAARPRGYLQTLFLFRRLVKLDIDRRNAKVETALPLSSDLQTAVQTGLTRAYGRGLDTSFAQNPVLIAGMRIKVGCDVYDGSINARLNAIEQSF